MSFLQNLPVTPISRGMKAGAFPVLGGTTWSSPPLPLISSPATPALSLCPSHMGLSLSFLRTKDTHSLGLLCHLSVWEFFFQMAPWLAPSLCLNLSSFEKPSLVTLSEYSVRKFSVENSICKAPEEGGLFDFFLPSNWRRASVPEHRWRRRLAQGEVRDKAGAKSQRTW